VTAFRPISPHDALQILDAAKIGADLQQLLANLAMAGVVKGYARLIETEAPGAARTEVRDSRIDRSIWRRILAEGRVADVYQAGSVHLGASGGAERTSVIGIRFDGSSVTTAASDHGNTPPSKPIVTGKAARRGAMSNPEQPTLALNPDADDPMSAHADGVDNMKAAGPRKVRASLDPNTVALSLDEAADVLGVSKGTVNNLVRAGKLVVTKIGRRAIVQADSVRALLA
jgi:excisionase family DNA binding protein